MNINVLTNYPQPDVKTIDALLEKEIAQSTTKLVVLDDDPTGVQTIHDISVYTDWSVESLRKGFRENNKVFFILTNSRGMTPAETTALHHEIVRNTAEAARLEGAKYLYMSRSDSTLRGHYPLETQLLKEGFEAANGSTVDGEILCPFFLEGGRYTIDNVHYVRYGEELVPAAETEFAKDKSFGYTRSALPEYIEEKTQGAVKAADVLPIPLDLLRAVDIDGIEKLLLGAQNYRRSGVNAIGYEDVKVFSIALYRAMSKGKTFVFRTAAGLVKVMGGVSDRPLRTRAEMCRKESGMGGLVVVGSHTKKTTAQLEALLALPGTEAIEFNSDLVLEGNDAFQAEIRRCVKLETDIIRRGLTAVCYTRRTLLTLPDDTEKSALKRSVAISEGVQRLVADLPVEPSFIVAKGGITSSDIGVKALQVRCANVMGQICAGVPVWETDATSRFPGIPYVIFPGNVGENHTLREAVEKLLTP